MKRKQLILDRYEVVGVAGAGGFGTVQIAWDPRIQRKVAIKTIRLTERDAVRAAVSTAQDASRLQDAASVQDANQSEGTTILLEEEQAPQKALSPAEARTARAQAKLQREEKERALSQAWETPWVQIPSHHAEANNDFAGVDQVDIALAEDDFQSVSDKSAKTHEVFVESDAYDVHVESDATQELRLPEIDAAHEVKPAVGDKHSLSVSIPLVVQVPEIEGSGSESISLANQVPEVSSSDTKSASLITQIPEISPADIIAEARASLKDLPAYDAHTSWDGRYPWDDEDDITVAPFEQTTELHDDSEMTTLTSSLSFEFEDVPFAESGSVAVSDENLQEETSCERKLPETRLHHNDLQEETPETPKNEPLTTLVHVPGLDEARTAAKLSDQRIVTVYDFEVRDQTAYLIMEYVEGITLAQLLADYPDYITLDMVTGVFDAVAGALEIAHDAGVLHLDVKPDNIIINKDGQVKVTDFGLATLADASGKGFAGGGTIGYMPLEQMRREKLDVRTDEWALAAMTYEMLTGGNPFKAQTLDQAEQAILNAELVLPSLCWPRIDSQIDDVVFYALDPDPEERYENIGDFADEIDKFLGDAESGQEQLALVVEDALSQPSHETEVVTDASRSRTTSQNHKGFQGLFKRFDLGRSGSREQQQASERPTLFASFFKQEDTPVERRPEFAPSDRLAEKLEEYGPDDALYEDDYYDEEDDVESVERIPLNQRVPDSVVAAAARIFNGIGCAFVSGLTFWNFEPIRSIPDAGAYFGVIVGAVIFGALGLIVPTYGALVSFCLLGLVICLCGHPIVGAVLIIATGLWWYVVGREGVAENNIALLAPLSLSIGIPSITPLFAGVSLKPLQAALTMLFSVILVCVFSSFGGTSFVGWESFGYPTLSGSDVTLAFARIFMRPLTLSMAIGWIAGAAIFSVLDLKASKWTFILGLILCVVCVLAGTLVFTAPTLQLFVALAVGVAVILVVFL